MKNVRLGLIGCGAVAQNHLRSFAQIDGLQFCWASDVNADSLRQVREQYGVRTDADSQALIHSGEVDAVLIATPHYFHAPLAKAAMAAGLHVLTEKPLAVTAKDAASMVDEARKHRGLVFAAMFNQRLHPIWREVKRLLDTGAVGELIRVSWTVQDWCRTQPYYDAGGWRATWAGEGGGVLINQCPHNLDLLCWFVGLPRRVVAAQVGLGKYHQIEVEDEVAALLEFDNGAIGTFVTSTAETSGINRLEIVGDHGTLIAEPRRPLTLIRNNTPVREYLRTGRERSCGAGKAVLTIEPAGENLGHRGIVQNFVNAILYGEQLISPATEGIHGLELGNAMLMAGLTGRPVDLPTDHDAFDRLLSELVRKSAARREAMARPQSTCAAT